MGLGLTEMAPEVLGFVWKTKLPWKYFCAIFFRWKWSVDLFYREVLHDPSLRTIGRYEMENVSPLEILIVILTYYRSYSQEIPVLI